MDDLISRKNAIEAIVNTVSDLGNHDNSEVARFGAAFRQLEIIDILQALPSAEPKQKTGKWIESEQRDRTICSVCGYWQDLKAKFLFSFCPNCGSLMRGGYTNENISDS